MRAFSIFVLAASAISMSACGSTNDQPSNSPHSEEAPNSEEAPEEAPSPPAADPAPTVEPADDAQAALFSRSVNALGIDLWKRLDAGNQAISPVSITIALDMTFGGARGETADQMAQVLHVEGGQAERDAFHAAVGGMAARYHARSENLTLAIANRLFGREGYRFEQPFVDQTLALYGAPMERLDFSDPEPARAHINAWIEAQTQDKIQDLIPSGGITGNTRLVLTNAIYLNAKWAEPFKHNDTHPATFYAEGSQEQQVPTMHASAPYLFGQSEGVSLLEMPYAEGDLAMLFVLPDARDGLAAVEETLDPEVLAGWVSALSQQYVRVALPAFRVAPETQELTTHLSALGMEDAFRPDLADFTAIANPPSPSERLSISAVYHKTFVDVNEEGTEAAAATAVVMVESAAYAPDAASFIADHPFLFFLRDTRSGAVLFMGRVTAP